MDADSLSQGSSLGDVGRLPSERVDGDGGAAPREEDSGPFGDGREPEGPLPWEQDASGAEGEEPTAAGGRASELRLMALQAQVDGEGMQAVAYLEEALQIALGEAGSAPGEGEEVAVVEGEALAVCEALVLAYNAEGMRLTEQRDFKAAGKLLKKADVLTASDSGDHATADGVLDAVPRLRDRLRAITLNNLGCFFRYQGRLTEALQRLLAALALEEPLAAAARAEADAAGPDAPRELGAQEPLSPCTSLLNICAVCSKLGMHEKALQYAKAAQVQAEAELLATGVPCRLPFPGQEEKMDDFVNDLQMCFGDEMPAAVSTLALAYHNQAVEFEHCKVVQKALRAYQRALLLARVFWGPDSGMTQEIARAADSFHLSTFQGRFRVMSEALLRPGRPRRAAVGRVATASLSATGSIRSTMLAQGAALPLEGSQRIVPRTVEGARTGSASGMAAELRNAPQGGGGGTLHYAGPDFEDIGAPLSSPRATSARPAARTLRPGSNRLERRLRMYAPPASRDGARGRPYSAMPVHRVSSRSRPDSDQPWVGPGGSEQRAVSAVQPGRRAARPGSAVPGARNRARPGSAAPGARRKGAGGDGGAESEALPATWVVEKDGVLGGGNGRGAGKRPPSASASRKRGASGNGAGCMTLGDSLFNSGPGQDALAVPEGSVGAM
ncbi:unnamed protein product [Pedinophyceae sp. YPF-701]|nr:unnamed protein product [Pedinophyceae sp. YPF-701]